MKKKKETKRPVSGCSMHRGQFSDIKMKLTVITRRWLTVLKFHFKRTKPSSSSHTYTNCFSLKNGIFHPLLPLLCQHNVRTRCVCIYLCVLEWLICAFCSHGICSIVWADDQLESVRIVTFHKTNAPDIFTKWVAIYIGFKAELVEFNFANGKKELNLRYMSVVEKV